MTFVLVVVGIVAVGVAGLIYWWSARLDAEAAHALPPLIYPLHPSPSAPRPQPHVKGNATPLTHVNGNGATHAHVNGNGATHTYVNGNGATRRPDAPVARPVAVEPPRMNTRTPVTPRYPEHDDTETIRFIRPVDDAVQLLPARLEVIEGKTPHKEIRFVRIPGEPVHVILGREVGLTPHYIGLESPTVSRRHARFDFADNQWVVKNLSRTNPLVVNDDEMFDTDVARPLADGDRLELGEVVLRFHAH